MPLMLAVVAFVLTNSRSETTFCFLFFGAGSSSAVVRLVCFLPLRPTGGASGVSLPCSVASSSADLSPRVDAAPFDPAVLQGRGVGPHGSSGDHSLRTSVRSHRRQGVQYRAHEGMLTFNGASSTPWLPAAASFDLTAGPPLTPLPALGHKEKQRSGGSPMVTGRPSSRCRVWQGWGAGRAPRATPLQAGRARSGRGPERAPRWRTTPLQAGRAASAGSCKDGE